MLPCKRKVKTYMFKSAKMQIVILTSLAFASSTSPSKGFTYAKEDKVVHCPYNKHLKFQVEKGSDYKFEPDCTLSLQRRAGVFAYSEKSSLSLRAPFVQFAVPPKTLAYAEQTEAGVFRISNLAGYPIKIDIVEKPGVMYFQLPDKEKTCQNNEEIICASTTRKRASFFLDSGIEACIGSSKVDIDEFIRIDGVDRPDTKLDKSLPGYTIVFSCFDKKLMVEKSRAGFAFNRKEMREMKSYYRAAMKAHDEPGHEILPQIYFETAKKH